MGPQSTSGDIAPKAGSLYCLLPGNETKFHIDQISCSNGLAWSADGKKFYYIDSFTFCVESFDFDIDAAKISMYILLDYIYNN